jgi:hypothetical protein
MYVRTTTQRNKDGTERLYCQIAQAYRRPDGLPASRVFLHLGPRSPLFVANRKAALAASSGDVALVPQSSSSQVVHFCNGASFTNPSIGSARVGATCPPTSWRVANPNRYASLGRARMDGLVNMASSPLRRGAILRSVLT